jgi:hypothetical protein
VLSAVRFSRPACAFRLFANADMSAWLSRMWVNMRQAM